ncbi:MAG TPA: three-Cys-motif partner protein TcmP [Opitutaceae bacterium]|nr:three-Cys-motif partner protein TcmP [Opitutaceae bacterium]
MDTSEEVYRGREQTRVKHLILEKYLEAFARIVGFRWDTITYVDCFSGPWNIQSNDCRDASFAIALNELRKARGWLRQKGRELTIRCFFIEKDHDAYSQLANFCSDVADAEIAHRNLELEEAIPEILRFVSAGGNGNFPFFFLDPNGWTGFAMDVISPLLQKRPAEVLVNFMTGHIRRFIDAPQIQTKESFRRLFGKDSFRDVLAGLERSERDDAVVAEYAHQVRDVGGFQYVCPAIILNPTKDSTHFHLLYATRNAKGVEVFKDVEKTTMPVMERLRGEAHCRKRVRKTGQSELALGDALHDHTHYENLRARYLHQIRVELERRLHSGSSFPYDEAWDLMAEKPLVWEGDLKSWIAENNSKGVLRIEGLRDNERVPKRGCGHSLVLGGHN